MLSQRAGPALKSLKSLNWPSSVHLGERDPTVSAAILPLQAMASKGLKDLKQQAEGVAQEAAASAGQALDQATEAGQKALDQLGKSTQEAVDKAANQASDSFSGLGKKFGLQK